MARLFRVLMPGQDVLVWELAVESPTCLGYAAFRFSAGVSWVSATTDLVSSASGMGPIFGFDEEFAANPDSFSLFIVPAFVRAGLLV